MKLLTLRITTESETLIGSGEGWGANIDTDVVLDDCGLPYIPAKRIKGCLRESALEVVEMFEQSGIDYTENLEEIFGKKGQGKTRVVFENLYIGKDVKEYEKIRECLMWGMHEFGHIISKETTASVLTSLRQQTAINKDEVAEEHSLRTIRVIKKGVEFVGKVHLPKDDKLNKNENLLSFAAKNLRYIGTKRNRGFGQITCSFVELNANSFISTLEKKTEAERCTK